MHVSVITSDLSRLPRGFSRTTRRFTTFTSSTVGEPHRVADLNWMFWELDTKGWTSDEHNRLLPRAHHPKHGLACMTLTSCVVLDSEAVKHTFMGWAYSSTTEMGHETPPIMSPIEAPRRISSSFHRDSYWICGRSTSYFLSSLAVHVDISISKHQGHFTQCLLTPPLLINNLLTAATRLHKCISQVAWLGQHLMYKTTLGHKSSPYPESSTPFHLYV